MPSKSKSLRPSKSEGPSLPAVANAERKPPTLESDWDGKKNLTINVSGDLDRIKSATSNCHVLDGLLGQLASLGARSKPFDDEATNFALGFVDAMAPRDAAEALLAAQMAAVHQATVMLARRLNLVESLPQQDSAERAFNKLARTYAAQMDTLKRYRSKGQQTVRVERVTVQDGGQAIVGNVGAGGGVHEET